jgi:chitosanase
MKFSFLPPNISEEVANRIIEVINVFETGSKRGKYGAFVAYKDFTFKGNNYKQITYGRTQTTEFGNLKSLLKMYIDAGGAYADVFRRYVNDIGKITNDEPISLWDNTELVATLKIAGNTDPIMVSTQDVFFDRYYVQPAIAFFTHHQFTLPLSLFVIYDSFVHSGSIRPELRQRFPELPPLQGGNEKRWIKQYVDVRYDWLKNHSKEILRNTIYRPQLFQRLIADNNWDLRRGFSTQGFDFE